MKKHTFRTFLGLLLCLCFLTEHVYAADKITYRETKYQCPVKNVEKVAYAKLNMDSSNRIRLLLDGYHFKNDGIDDAYSWKSFVTYDAKGNQTVDTLPQYLSGNDFLQKNDLIYTVENMDEKEDLYICDKNGNILKKWRGDICRRLGIERSDIWTEPKIADVTGKYNVTLFYLVWDEEQQDACSYAVRINIKTGKFKKLYSMKFPVLQYDGAYAYGYKENADKGTITFYRKSVKTKKTQKFTVNALKPVKIGKYAYEPKYTFSDGKVMGITPKGGVYYGTFKKGVFQKIGTISSCKNFKKYEMQSIAMKSKKQFYVAYSNSEKKGKTQSDWGIGNVFVVKYSKE